MNLAKIKKFDPIYVAFWVALFRGKFGSMDTFVFSYLKCLLPFSTTYFTLLGFFMHVQKKKKNT